MQLTPQVVLLLALIALCVSILVLYLIRLYNALIFMRNNAEKAFANIDVLLQQRFDEIPNQSVLVNAATEHENELLNYLTFLRNQNESSDSLSQWQQRLHHLNRSFSLVNRVTMHKENYPSLVSNDLFIAFKQRVLEFENKISESRIFYNDCATLFNDTLMLIPNRLLMSPFGMVELELLNQLDPKNR